jgi:HD-GYP domain-containing protein (c-di-GMP phosphodiesterase class II)
MSVASDYLELVRQLMAAVNGRRIYPPHHPVLDRAVAKIEQALHHLMVSRDEVQLGVLGSHLLADGLPWEEQEEPHSLLSQELRSRNIDKLTFQRGFTKTDLDSLLEVLAGDLATPGPRLPDSVCIADLLAGRGVSRIRVGHFALTEPDAAESTGERVAGERATYQDAVSGVGEAMECARTGRFIRTRQVVTLVEGLMEHLSRDPGPLLMLSTLRSHSEYTHTHIVNVTILTLAQVQAMSADPEIVREYGVAAMMHDMGKVKIPREILDNRGRLTEADFEIIRRHPVDSLHLLRESPGVGDLALIVAFEHHRRFDGTGYPVLPEPTPQHFASRMVALADAYDAMRSNRSYQREIPPEQALQILQQQSGKMFDPVLVRSFVRMMGAFPPGTRIRLDTGEEAMVLKANPEDPYRPIVRLLEGVSGRDGQLRLVNLSERDPKTGAYLRSATCSLP